MFFFAIFVLVVLIVDVFLSTEARGSYLDFFPSILIHFWLFRHLFNALLNTSAFICRLLDTVKNTLFPMIFVLISNLSCYMM